MFRTLFVLGIVGVGLWGAFRSPFHGLLLYLFLAYFRPEQWVWTDLIASLNLSLIAGVLLLARMLVSEERIKFSGRSWLLCLFATHGLISTTFSDYPDWTAWQNFAKCIIVTVLMISLSTDVKRHRQILIVIALSLGFEATKQGWAQLVLNPGGRNDNYIPFLGDNNAVAVGMWMLVPVLVALARTAPAGWERRGFQFLNIGVIYRSIVTYSRGGFLTAGVVALCYILRSKQRVRTLVGIVVVAALIVPVLPDAFWARMQTIEVPQDEQAEDEQVADQKAADDRSSAGRLHFWRVAVKMAAANPIMGVGHGAYNSAYDAYDFLDGEYGHARSVHSAWFGVLAELGYVGLFLFALNLGSAVLACRRVRLAVRGRPEMAHVEQFAIAHEVSLIAFAVGGTFVALAYNEMLWHFIGLTIALENLVNVPVSAAAPRQAEGALRPLGAAARPTLTSSPLSSK